MVFCFKFLEIKLSEDPEWDRNTTIVKKAQQCLFFLQILKKNNLSPELLLPLLH